MTMNASGSSGRRKPQHLAEPHTPWSALLRSLERIGLVPDYTFSGGTIGGESVMACSCCGALIKERDVPSHEAWETRVGQAISQLTVEKLIAEEDTHHDATLPGL